MRHGLSPQSGTGRIIQFTKSGRRSSLQRKATQQAATKGMDRFNPQPARCFQGERKEFTRFADLFIGIVC